MELTRPTLFVIAIALGLAGVGVTVGAFGPAEAREILAEPASGLPDQIEAEVERIAPTAELIIRDQIPTNYFKVDRVTIHHPRGGFVIVYSLVQSVPDTLVGASAHLAPGGYAGAKVELLRNINLNDELLAILHHDNGDRIFIAETDPPVRLNSSQLVMTKFTARLNASTPL